MGVYCRIMGTIYWDIRSHVKILETFKFQGCIEYNGSIKWFFTGFKLSIRNSQLGPARKPRKRIEPCTTENRRPSARNCASTRPIG